MHGKLNDHVTNAVEYGKSFLAYLLYAGPKVFILCYELFIISCMDVSFVSLSSLYLFPLYTIDGVLLIRFINGFISSPD